jgi:endonuclease I
VHVATRSSGDSASTQRRDFELGDRAPSSLMKLDRVLVMPLDDRVQHAAMQSLMSWRTVALLLSFVCAAERAEAQGAPPGYYASVDTTSAATLRQTLHNVIKDHTRYPYTSTSTDTWDILNLASEDPANTANIIDVYKNQSLLKQPGGNSFYDREHTWPNSYGFPNDVATNYPYTDCHMLFLSDPGYNSSRGNSPYSFCANGCNEKPTVLTNGQGGGTGAYPGNSNWTSGSSSTGRWETWIGKRGDVARALFYADVRYEGGFHSITGAPEPDLILTDNTVLIASSNTGNNESVAYMGLLTSLLQWNQSDPPDDWERHRNDVVQSFQGNRDPFIDHPEWVPCIFQGVCSTGTPFCFGDGTQSTPCPCGNNGATGHGCASSQVAAGAVLKAMGTTTPDMLVLTASQTLPSALSIFLQGDGLVATGAVFGDGVRCAGGHLLRLGSRNAVMGVTQYPDGADLSISARSAALGSPIAPGAMRYYQTYYRDPNLAFCAAPQGNTWNVTNGVIIAW